MALHKDPDSDAPFKMKAKRDGECAECENVIDEGSEMVWDPKNFKAYCPDCGEEYLDETPPR